MLEMEWWGKQFRIFTGTLNSVLYLVGTRAGTEGSRTVTTEK